ncbi:unnamed protein product [Rhizophagus irregularis]|nr:unnamed protein product [Rhizophagus irregularis]
MLFRTPHFEGSGSRKSSSGLLISKVLEAENQVSDSSFRRLWKLKVQFWTPISKVTPMGYLNHFVAGLLDEPGLWNYVSEVARLSGLWNYVSRVAGRIIRTGLWNLGCQLLDEPSSTNFHKLWDFGIMLPDFRCTWTLELCYRTFG